MSEFRSGFDSEMGNTGESNENNEASELSSNEFGKTTSPETFESERDRSFENEELSGQELAENTHELTKSEVLENYGQYMSDERIRELESPETAENLSVISAKDYISEYPDQPFEVLGHCEQDGTIVIKDISDDMTRHISTHETMHLCSDRESYIDENGVKHIKSGFRESEVVGEVCISDLDRGFNEGCTEMYTLKALIERRDLEAANSVTAYSEGRKWAGIMERLIGPEKMNAAYFGDGKQEFVDEVNRLSGDENGWYNFSKNLDDLEKAEYEGYDEDTVSEIRARLNTQFNTMLWNKRKENL